MSWSVLVVSLALHAGEPCEAPRVRDTAPLLTAIAQDKVLGLAFSKAAGLCAQPGDACDQARLECAGLLKATIEKQQAFDDGAWLRDMLLPYLGANYAMTRTFGPAAPAADASCNVDVATLEAASQRRLSQAARREGLSQEYAGYVKWTQAQLAKCREQRAADEVKAAAAKAEADRIAAASAASAAAAAATAAAAEEIRKKQAAEASAAEKAREEAKRREEQAAADREKERRLAEERAKAQEQARKDELAAAEKRRQEDKEEAARLRKEAEEKAEREKKEALARAEKEKEEALERAEREKREAKEEAEKEKREAQEQAEREKKEAERKAREAEERRLIDERNTRVAEQRALKARIVKEAEDALELAKHEEIVKKQAALAAVEHTPTTSQEAVAAAAQAEAVRIDAEKKLVEARQKADAIVIDDSFERSRGSVFIAGGGAANAGGFGLGVLAGLHLGFWGDAPSEGMASGLELRLWGRYSGQVAGTPTATLDALLTARYFFGPFGVGLGGSLGLSGNGFSTLGVGTGPSLGLMFIDSPTWRVGLNGTWLPVGTSLDVTRFNADMEVSWRFLTVQVHGGSLGSVQVPDGPMQLAWSVGGFVGVRGSW